MTDSVLMAMICEEIDVQAALPLLESVDDQETLTQVVRRAISIAVQVAAARRLHDLTPVLDRLRRAAERRRPDDYWGVEDQEEMNVEGNARIDAAELVGDPDLIQATARDIVSQCGRRRWKSGDRVDAPPPPVAERALRLRLLDNGSSLCFLATQSSNSPVWYRRILTEVDDKELAEVASSYVADCAIPALDTLADRRSPLLADCLDQIMSGQVGCLNPKDRQQVREHACGMLGHQRDANRPCWCLRCEALVHDWHPDDPTQIQTCHYCGAGRKQVMEKCEVCDGLGHPPHYWGGIPVVYRSTSCEGHCDDGYFIRWVEQPLSSSFQPRQYVGDDRS